MSDDGISYSERRSSDGTTAAIGVIPSGRPADAPSVPPPRTESHGAEAGGDQVFSEASGAPGGDEGPPAFSRLAGLAAWPPAFSRLAGLAAWPPAFSRLAGLAAWRAEQRRARDDDGAAAIAAAMAPAEDHGAAPSCSDCDDYIDGVCTYRVEGAGPGHAPCCEFRECGASRPFGRAPVPRPPCWGDCASTGRDATPETIGCDDCDMREAEAPAPEDHGVALLASLNSISCCAGRVPSAVVVTAHGHAEALIADLAAEREAREKAEAEAKEFEEDANEVEMQRLAWKGEAEREKMARAKAEASAAEDFKLRAQAEARAHSDGDYIRVLEGRNGRLAERAEKAEAGVTDLELRLSDIARTHQAMLDRLHDVERQRDDLDVRLRRALERQGCTHTAEATDEIAIPRDAAEQIAAAVAACEPYQRGTGLARTRGEEE